MSVNLDVLELIVALLDAPDLAAAALVSRIFLAAALPALYAHIEYTLRHAKRAHASISPFATLAAHGHLLVHLKRVALHAAPVLHQHVCPSFLADLARVLRTATNLRAFVCTVNILPPLLPCLLHKHRLHHLRVVASLGSRQLSVLRDVSDLHSLSLDFPSWNVVDGLPNWSASMQRTLSHLTLFMSQDVDATALNAILAQLPHLRGLHVIGCPRISHSTVLKALSHTPDLLELSITIFPSQEIMVPQLNFSAPPLTHLSIDVRASHPALKPLIARIISHLTPRVALAVCGGWIGEIKSSSEHTDTPSNPGIADTGSNVYPWQTHSHLGGPVPAHAHGQPEDPPLLTPPHPHHIHPRLNHAVGPPNQNNPPPPPDFVPPFGFPFGHPNGDNNDHPAGPPSPAPGPDLNSPLLVASLPSTLSVLHLPLISPPALREIVERCQGIQVLGIVIGTAFGSQPSAKSTRSPGRPAARSVSRPKQAIVPGARPEVSVLANILSRASALRELIIDTSSTDIGGASATDSRADGSHGAFRGVALLTPSTARMLMRESPLLRRIVGEGRIWESPTPIPSLPVPFPHCLPIDLTLSKARYGPGANSHHAYGPPGFGPPGGGYNHVEMENDHWFWLTGSASGGTTYSRY